MVDLLLIGDELRREYALATTAATSALDHARRCGLLLREAKSSVAHGQWAEWLRSNFAASERTAQNYMRLAACNELADPQRVADLSVRRALTSMSSTKNAPREYEPPPSLSDFERAVVDSSEPAAKVAKDLGTTVDKVRAVRRQHRSPVAGMLATLRSVDTSIDSALLAVDLGRLGEANAAQVGELRDELDRIISKVRALRRNIAARPSNTRPEKGRTHAS